jgi:type IV secretory pathway VirB2 component (pilin)
MASRKKKFIRHLKQPIPLLIAAPVAWKAIGEPLFGNPSAGIGGALNAIQGGDIKGGVQEFIDILGINFLGYKFSDGSNWWSRGFPLNTYVPIALGVVGHKLANRFGVNRVMKRIPIVGKYIAL